MFEELGNSILDSTSQQIVNSVVENFIKSKIEKWKPNFKKGSKENEELSATFEKYLGTMYLKSENMSTIILHKTPTRIENLYVPLTLESESKEIQDFKVEKDINNFLKTYQKIIITDSAGMGKSTVLKWMFRKCIEENEGVPILIELRKIKEDNTIVDEICNELNSLNNSFEKNLILNMIDSGGFTFFFDGFDEISLDDRKEVTSNLQDFIFKAQNNNFILTSRQDEALLSFKGFYHFKLKPLSSEQAFELLLKYATIDGSVDATYGLIEEIKDEKNYENLKTFLTNPLMVTLLYKGYDYKQTIPYKKSIFYRQVYDALFEGHDLSKGEAFSRPKESGLDIETFHTTLRSLAFITFIKSKIEYSRDEIVRFMNDAKKLSQIDFEPHLLLNDLQKNVPMFYKEGNNYRWAHKSLQEYFAASYICIDSKEKQEKYLNNIYVKKLFTQYMNVLDLCYDMDYKSVKKTIIYNFAKDIKNDTDAKQAVKVFNNQWEFFRDSALFIPSKNNDNSFKEIMQTHELRELIDDLSSKLNKKVEFSVSSSISPVIGIFYSNVYFELIKFLYSKGERFIKIFETHASYDPKYFEEISDNLVLNLQHENETKIYLLREDSPFWKSKVDLFNQAIEFVGQFHRPGLIYTDFEEIDKIIKSVEKIERDSIELEI